MLYDRVTDLFRERTFQPDRPFSLLDDLGSLTDGVIRLWGRLSRFWDFVTVVPGCLFAHEVVTNLPVIALLFFWTMSCSFLAPRKGIRTTGCQDWRTMRDSWHTSNSAKKVEAFRVTCEHRRERA